MKEFESVEELREELESDSREYSRFPARFILTEDLESWNEVNKFLESWSSSILYLSNYCKEKDTLPNFRIAKEEIEKGLKGAVRISIVPFSEYLRFFPKGAEFLRELAVWERLDEWNRGTKTRVYAPLFGMGSTFNKEMGKLSRFQFHEEGECAKSYLLRSSGRTCRKLELVLNVVKEGVSSTRLSENRIDGMKEYFRLWERKMSAGEYVLVTDLIKCIEETEGNLVIRIFDSNLRVLRHILDDGDRLKEEWGDEEMWLWLLRLLPLSATSLREAFENIPNISFDPQYVFLRWQEYKPEEKWLIWLRLKLENPGGYLGFVMDKNKSFNSFEDDLINTIFSIDPEKITLELAIERKKILESVLGEASLPSSFWEKFDYLQDSSKLKYLTGLTEGEKIRLIEIVSNYTKNMIREGEWFEYLSVAYPDLKYYLFDFNYGEKEVSEYFYHYKRAKLTDEVTCEVKDLVYRIAESKAFFKFPPREEVLERYEGYVYWFDALGVEWLSFIEGVLKEYDHIKYTIEIARSNLPTITDINKGWENVADYRYYDRLIHDNVMPYPDYIIREFECVKEGIKGAVSKLDSYPMVIVTSDHGSSRLGAISEEFIPLAAGTEPEKYGRYVKSNGNAIWDYREFVEQDNYIISATHKRFSGGGYRAVEVHGGAALEEVLVPIIIIERKREIHSKIEIVGVSDRVKLNQEGEGVLTVSLNAPVERLELIAQNKRFDGTYKGDRWEFKLRDLKSGTHRGELRGKDGKIGDINFEVTKGIIERDLGL